jgi:hypothetical protein
MVGTRQEPAVTPLDTPVVSALHVAYAVTFEAVEVKVELRMGISSNELQVLDAELQ